MRFPSLLNPESVERGQSGSCWLKAILMAQSAPVPDDDTDEQVGKSMSIVPSRSTESIRKATCQRMSTH